MDVWAVDEVGYFGAVGLRDGKFFYEREEDVFNAETFFCFVKRLRQSSSHAKREVLKNTLWYGQSQMKQSENYAQLIKTLCII